MRTAHHPRSAVLPTTMLAALTLVASGLTLSPSASASASAAPVGATSSVGGDRTAQRVKPLAVKTPQVSCECGGAGYLWGWSVVYFQIEGAREGYTYRAMIKGGGQASSINHYGNFASASFTMADHSFELGRSYSFVVKEYKRKKLVRSSKAQRYTIPTPVSHPETARLDLLEGPDGQLYLVAGRTHTVTYDGEWEDGAQFAKGVDRYIDANGDFGGYYEEQDYPLPWTEGAADPSLSLSPLAEHLGQQWNIYVVGSRPAPRDVPRQGIEAGDPVRGSEWGHRWFVTIISEEEAADLGAPARAARSRGSRT